MRLIYRRDAKGGRRRIAITDITARQRTEPDLPGYMTNWDHGWLNVPKKERFQ